MTKLAKNTQKRKDKGPKMDLKFCLVVTQKAGSKEVEVHQAFSPPLGVSNAGKEFAKHNIGDLIAPLLDHVEIATGVPQNFGPEEATVVPTTDGSSELQ